MTEKTIAAYPNVSREPWNKGKLIGPKPPLRPKHVWATPIYPNDGDACRLSPATDINLR